MPEPYDRDDRVALAVLKFVSLLVGTLILLTVYNEINP